MVIHNYCNTPNADRYASYFFTRISTQSLQLPLKPGVIVPRMTTDVNSCPLERPIAVRMGTLRNHTDTGYTRSTFINCFICGNSDRELMKDIIQTCLYVLVTWGWAWSPHCKAR